MTSATRHGALSIAATLAVWEVLAKLIDTPMCPPLSTVLGALLALVAEGRIFGNLSASVSTLVLGFGLAVPIGVVAGLLTGMFPAIDRVCLPYLQAGLAAPPLIYVPVLFSIGGTSRWTQVGTVVLYSVFVIASYAREGVRHTHRPTIEMARSFGATRWQLFVLVVWPGARPMLAGGLRVAVGMAVKGMINGEMLIATTGLGALVRVYGGRFEVERLLAVLMVIVAVALVSTGALRSVERRTLGQGTAS